MSNDIPQKIDKEQLRNLIHVNPDARQYFHAKTDERWLDWLWENEFLDVIRERAEDPTRYGEPYPELNFLVRMSEKTPAKVVDIMLQVPISSETFNPVVVDRFLVICRTLPAKQLAFDDLSSTEVFKYLSHMNAEYREQTFGLATKVMADITTLSNKKLVLSDQEQLLQLTEQAFGDEEEIVTTYRPSERAWLPDLKTRRRLS